MDILPQIVNKDELIKSRKSPTSGSGRGNFWRILLQHCEIGYLSTIWLISLEKNYHTCKVNLWTRQSPLNCGSRPDPDSGSQQESPWRRPALSKCPCSLLLNKCILYNQNKTINLWRFDLFQRPSLDEAGTQFFGKRSKHHKGF